MKKQILTLLTLAIASGLVDAGTAVCSGKIAELAYHANNRLMIRLETMNKLVFFCSPDSEWSVAGTNYVSGPETCKTLYSTFLSAKISGKSITSLYFDGDDVPASCNNWGSWKKANIRFFQIEN